MLIRTGTDVAAPAQTVYGVYADYNRWPEIFPTIHAVRLVASTEHRVVLAIDHQEGQVRNVLRLFPPDRILLDEEKRAYDATFTNRFRPAGVGTRFEVKAEIRLKGFRRLLAPVIPLYARHLVKRLQLTPVKAEAERRFAEGSSTA